MAEVLTIFPGREVFGGPYFTNFTCLVLAGNTVDGI